MKPFAKSLAFAMTLGGVLALAACSKPMATPEAPRLKPECGVASYYHKSLAGERTASGETYEPTKLTAAHQELPFGTVVRVIRQDEEGSVTVTINDRGPFVKGRIIDLSRAAAKRIGIHGEEGLANVCLRIVRD